MENAVQTAQTTTISAELEKVKTLLTLQAWVRDYPELMYVGMYMPNMFADGGKLKNWQLSIAEQKQLSFKTIGALESTMSVNANEVTWYEAGLYIEEALVTEDATASNTIKLDSKSVKHFKVNDLVEIKPWVWSATADVKAKVTGVDLLTNTLTLDTAVTVAVKDQVLFLYNLITFGTEITRWVSESDVTPVKTYFQTFGESVEFDSNEINQTRLLLDAKNYVKTKFATGINSANQRFARTFYVGRNVAGSQSETQWLDAVIEEMEARDWVGSAIIDFSSITDTKARAKKLIQVINEASSAPVYNGWEVPTIFCNYEFISRISEIKFDMANYITLDQKELAFGIQAYSSPYFRWVEFIVSHTLNRLEKYRAVAYMFPKHLVTFKTPEYQSVNESGALITNKVGWYQVLKMPQVSVDKVKYTAQMRIANVFAGQSFKNTYKKLINF